MLIAMKRRLSLEIGMWAIFRGKEEQIRMKKSKDEWLEQTISPVSESRGLNIGFKACSDGGVRMPVAIQWIFWFSVWMSLFMASHTWPDGSISPWKFFSSQPASVCRTFSDPWGKGQLQDNLETSKEDLGSQVWFQWHQVSRVGEKLKMFILRVIIPYQSKLEE